MSKYWSPIVERLVPYIPGEQPKGQSFIKLNTNENPYGPSAQVLDAIRDATNGDLRLYPDPTAAELRGAIGGSFGLSSDNVFVGNGSDEVLAHAFQAFFTQKSSILFADITYSFYKTYCELYQIHSQQLPLTESFEYDLKDYDRSCGGVVIANPNAPTGIAMGLEQIEQILRQNSDVVVLVDEAYVDFGTQSAASLVADHENLLVVQTLSKSRSLAGMRVGFALGQPHLIEALVRVKDSFNSYPLDRLALVGSLAAWRDKDWFNQVCRQVISDRELTIKALKNLGFEVLPSAANFLFVSHDEMEAADILSALRVRGILVRHFSHPRIANWLRISIGTRDECDQLIHSLADILEPQARTTEI